MNQLNSFDNILLIVMQYPSFESHIVVVISAIYISLIFLLPEIPGMKWSHYTRPIFRGHIREMSPCLTRHHL